MIPIILRYFFSAALIVAVVSPVFSQAKKKKKPDPADTIKHKYVPTGLRLGVDMISIIKTRVVSSFKGEEINADLDFYRYYLAVDYGTWARNYELVNGNYKNTGNYYRIGIDKNFMLKDPDHNMFFIGFRYAHSSFNESLSYTYTDSIYGGNNYSISKVTSNPSLTAHWFELTAGMRVKIWKGFWMGYTARMKFDPRVKGNKVFATFDIPGYGLAEKGNYWGINYQLFWRFPVRKIK